MVRGTAVTMFPLLVGLSCGRDAGPSEADRGCRSTELATPCNDHDAGAVGTPEAAGGARSTDGGGGRGGSQATADVSSLCEDMTAHEAAVCPGSITPDDEKQACVRQASLFVPEGCGPAWTSYDSCRAQAPLDCKSGPIGCDSQEADYRSCDSQFALKNICTRVLGHDDECTAEAPYAFGCLGGLPSGCVPRVTGAVANDACCVAFAPP